VAVSRIPPGVRRRPAPAIPGRPPCFGISHRAIEMCAACAWAATCAPICARWRKVRSLGELLADAEEELLASPSDIRLLYRTLHFEHFGHWPQDADVYGQESRYAFARVERWCKQGNIDPADYIAVQMDSMRIWVDQHPEVGFQPRMLSSDRALIRWDAAMNRERRSLRGGSRVALADETPLHRLLSELADEEERVLRLLCIDRCAGSTTTTEAAAGLTGASALWASLMGVASSLAAERVLAPYLTHHDLMRTVVLLRGAVAVAASYAAPLPMRMACTPPLTREAFAGFIAEMYPMPSRAERRLDPRLGLEWP
jgi:hypothetical protein